MLPDERDNDDEIETKEPSAKRRKIQHQPSEISDNFSDLSLQSLSDFDEIDETDIPKSIPDVSEFIVESFDKNEKSIETECGRKIFIQGQWDLTNVKKGSIINVAHLLPITATKNGNENNNLEPIIIAQSNPNFALITHPKVLISTTTIVQSISCQRKSILAQRYNRAGEFSAAKAMLLGSILHETFQDAVKNQTFDLENLKILGQHHCNISLLQQLLNETSSEKLYKEVSDYLPSIALWFKTYFIDSEKFEKMSYPVESSQKLKIDENQETNIAINQEKSIQIEENYWNYDFGIKGKIDMTAEIFKKNPKKAISHLGPCLVLSADLSVPFRGWKRKLVPKLRAKRASS